MATAASGRITSRVSPQRCLRCWRSRNGLARGRSSLRRVRSIRSIEVTSPREQARALRSGALSVPDLLEQVLLRIGEVEPAINSFITLADPELLRHEAITLQRELESGRNRGPLHGIPIGIKDVIETRALRTSGGSAALDDWIPDTDATAVARLREAGALIVGKHNTHEFAFGITTDNARFGPCLNPWHRGHVPGGSSGGSGAAVGAGLCIGALATDTGASIRRPAAYCGAVGLKPSYGRVPRTGAMLLSWSLDHVGPIAASVFDAVAMLDALAGHDPADAASRAETWQPLAPSLSESHGLRTAGVPRRWIETICEPGVAACFEDACRTAQRAGLRLIDIDPPFKDELLPALRLISVVEAQVAHEARFAARGERYSAELKMLVRLGDYIPAPHYVKAQQLRARVRTWLKECFADIDLLLTPTMPGVAPPIASSGQAAAAPAVMADASGLFCSFGAVGGLPSVSIPMGLSAGLPCGLLVTGPGRSERPLLRLAAALEALLPILPSPPL